MTRFAELRTLYRSPVWIDVARDDPFYEADVTLAHELKTRDGNVRSSFAAVDTAAGSGRMPESLRFYAKSCPKP